MVGLIIKTKKSKYSVLLIFMGLFFLIPLCKSAPAVETITISVTEEFEKSLDEAIFTAIAEKLGSRITIINAPFKRRLHLMKNGTIDLMAGLLKRPEREEYIHYIDPPYKNRSDTVFIVPKGKKKLIQSYDDLRPLRIGTQIGSKYFHPFDNDTTLTKEMAPKGTCNFMKLLHDRLDTVVIAESFGIDLINRMGVAQQLEIADFRFSEKENGYIGISKKAPIMKHLSKIEAVIKDLITSGEMKTIIINYYTSRNLPIPAL